MADVLHRVCPDGNGNIIYVFYCPGCENNHPVHVPFWEWNSSLEKPTFSPSLLVNGSDETQRCHSFIKDGKIQFLDDCFHSLKGQTVDIPEW